MIFLGELCKVFRNTFFKEHLRTTASGSHWLSSAVTRSTTRCHSLSLVVSLVFIYCITCFHSLSLVANRWHPFCKLKSFSSTCSPEAAVCWCLIKYTILKFRKSHWKTLVLESLLNNATGFKSILFTEHFRATTSGSHSMSFAVTRCHLLSLVVIRCHLLYHSL